MFHKDKINEIFPGATESQITAMTAFVENIINTKISSVQIDSDKINIVTVDTGMLPYTKATKYLEMIAEQMKCINSQVECIFVGGKQDTTVITLPSEPCIVKIPVGYMGHELVDRFMAKFDEFERNLHEAGYTVKFVADRGSGSITIE